MERRKVLTHGWQGVVALAVGATYTDARKVPVLEVRIAALERQLQILWQRNRYFHGHTTESESEAASGARGDNE